MTASGRLLLVLLASLAVCRPAQAHPHVFVTAVAAIAFDAEGRMTQVRHVWQFDEAFSAFATQGLDGNGDGNLSEAELGPLAKVNVDALKEYGYFTRLSADGTRVQFDAPNHYFARMFNGLLTLYFELPLAAPTRPGRTTRLEVYDPEYFVAFRFEKEDPITLDHPPAGCKGVYHPPATLDAGTMARLSAVPLDQHDLPAELRGAAIDLANVIVVTCPQ